MLRLSGLSLRLVCVHSDPLPTPTMLGEYQRSYSGKRGCPAPPISATSRKNKLQRCSVCGGLGHKSRTCPDNNTRMSSGRSSCLTESNSLNWASDEAASNSWSDEDQHDDNEAAFAAYGLINLSRDPSFSPSTCSEWASEKLIQAPQQAFVSLASPPQQPFSQPYWQPLMT